MSAENLMTVNTQTQTYAQIHTHAQIPAYIQLPALFQPRVPLQPSIHLHHNQVPCPATISTDPPSLAETPLITHRLCIISIDGNGAAACDLSRPHTLATGRRLHQKDYSLSSVSFSLHPHSSPIPVSTSLTPIIPVYSTLSHVTF